MLEGIILVRAGRSKKVRSGFKKTESERGLKDRWDLDTWKMESIREERKGILHKNLGKNFFHIRNCQQIFSS